MIPIIAVKQHFKIHKRRQKGAAIIFIAICFLTIALFGALSMEVHRLQTINLNLLIAAETGAHAGAETIKQGDTLTNARANAESVTLTNVNSSTILKAANLTTTKYDTGQWLASSGFNSKAPLSQHNAVRVTLEYRDTILFPELFSLFSSLLLSKQAVAVAQTSTPKYVIIVQ